MRRKLDRDGLLAVALRCIVARREQPREVVGGDRETGRARRSGRRLEPDRQRVVAPPHGLDAAYQTPRRVITWSANP